MLATNLDKVRGLKFQSWNRTLGEGDFMALNNLCWTIDYIHTDRERMSQTEFGERLLPGPLILAVVAGLMMTTPILQVIADHAIRVVALITYEDIRFMAPVQPGDSLRTELEIPDAHPTSKPNRGILKIKDTVFKQTGECVLEATRVFVVEGMNR